MKCKNVKPGVKVAGIALSTLLLLASSSFPRLLADLETGIVSDVYNDVRIPGTTGTLFSLCDDLKTDPSLFFRFRLTYLLAERHSASLLIAPLRLKGAGQLDRPVSFEGVDFPAGTPLESVYRFDSYRVGYRYDFFQSGRINAGLGITAKVRAASISLEGGGRESEKKNTGLVPLVSFMAAWQLSRTVSLTLDGEALGAPQGRAEDVLLALLYAPSERLRLKAGYRVLEGGADVDEVYNFTMLQYAVAGVAFSL